MSDSNLRAKLIRLAHTQPEMRKVLLPLLKEAGGVWSVTMHMPDENIPPLAPAGMTREEWLASLEIGSKVWVARPGGQLASCWGTVTKINAKDFVVNQGGSINLKYSRVEGTNKSPDSRLSSSFIAPEAPKRKFR